MKKLLLVLGFVALTSVAFAQFPKFQKHTLVETYISEGYVASAPPHDAPLDAVHTISCPGTSGTCTFQLDAWVDARTPVTDTNPIAICFYVDGSNINSHGNCYYSGNLPLDGSFLEASTSLSKDGIPVGDHTVQTRIYTADGAEVFYYNANYKVYKP
jgi:hypothetical protein